MGGEHDARRLPRGREHVEAVGGAWLYSRWQRERAAYDGRLTLEHWLTPRLDWATIHHWPGTEVAELALSASGDELRVTLSNSEQLTVDRLVFASGYRANLTRVPYLVSLLPHIELADGFPVLDEFFATTVADLYITGFSATRDFGPFFGFVKGSAAAATLIVRDLVSRD